MLLAFLLLFLPLVAHAAPPAIDVKPVFGDGLVQGVWQPVTVQLTNPADGDFLTGEVEVTPINPRNSQRASSCSVPVTLPRGVGMVTVSVPVRVPLQMQPDLMVTLRRGRDSSGEVVTFRQFDKLPVLPERLTIAAVSANANSLAFLNGERLGTWQVHGALFTHPVGSNAGGYQPYIYQSFHNVRSGMGPPPARVVPVTNVANLPLRAAEYEGVGVVFLGADTRPDPFSDAQVNALRQYVASGGLLVSAAPSLTQDARFRAWVPRSAPGATAQAYIGRGTVAALGFDPDIPSPTTAGADTTLWRKLLQKASMSAPPLSDGRGSQALFTSDISYAVLRAPGLQPPSYRAVGGFLAVYLLLLVPLNYLLLKRLKKRELAWFSVPALVVLFSVAAYGFGNATKGNRLLLNTVSLVEMQANHGEASVQTTAGLFSPRRSDYRVTFDVSDALPQGQGEEYGSSRLAEPLRIHVEDNKGPTVEGFNVAMWAMRPVSAHSDAIRIGDGLEVHLSRAPVTGSLQGTVRNRTGHALTDVYVQTQFYSLNLGNLADGQTATVALTGQRVFSNVRSRRSRALRGRAAPYRPVGAPSRSAAGGSLVQEMQTLLQQGVSSRLARTTLRANEAIILARDDTPVVPVRIDGRIPQNHNHTGMLIVHATVE